MRRSIAIALVAGLLLSGCARDMEICGATYTSYGLLNQDDRKNPDIEYRLVWGNVIWGAILVETVVAPIYFFGFSIFEPVGKKSPIKGAIAPPGKC